MPFLLLCLPVRSVDRTAESLLQRLLTSADRDWFGCGYQVCERALAAVSLGVNVRAS
jgi:hypothetical protein